MKRIIEIEDNLDEIIGDTRAEIKQMVEDWLTDNPAATSAPELEALNHDGLIDETIDRAVPIMTAHIDGLWYLYDMELEEAYENAGIGDNPRENNGRTAIYCLIDERVRKWYVDNSEDIFDNFIEKVEI